MLVRLRFVSNTVVWVPLQTLACETYEAGLRGPAGDPACERITLRGWHSSIRRDNSPELAAPADHVGAQLTSVAPSLVRVIDAGVSGAPIHIVLPSLLLSFSSTTSSSRT